MRVIRDLLESGIEQPTVVTIGAFDGLHLGHQQLLMQLVRRAKDTQRLSAVLTFDPLPREVLAPDSNTTCLMTVEDKITLLQAWGLDLTVLLSFTTELAATPAREFLQLLCQHLHMTELWVGWDFALGRGRGGNVGTLPKLGQALGFDVHVVKPVREGDVVISSTEIRHLIAAGRVREAAEMLGRYHELRGHVVHGDGRGRTLCFPTANIDASAHCAIPGQGVYAVYATIESTGHAAVANIGVRPTFGPGQRTMEVHVLDFAEQIYGKEMRIEFVERLRAERQFPDQKALCAQIEKDIAMVREILQ